MLRTKPEPTDGPPLYTLMLLELAACIADPTRRPFQERIEREREQRRERQRVRAEKWRQQVEAKIASEYTPAPRVGSTA
jgi:hypothetical protein